MTQRSKLAGRTLATLSIIGCCLVTGCGLQSASTAPTPGGVTGQFIRIPESGTATVLPGTPVAYPMAEQMITAADGGTLQLGRMTLTFPPGALQEDTEISMHFSNVQTLQVELEPHGIQFQKAVTLSADLSGLLDPGAQWVGVAWWNESESRWDEISRQSASSTVTAELWHFSRYDVFTEG